MVTFEAFTNYAGDGLVKVRHWDKTIQTLRIGAAKLMRAELDAAIEAAEAEERKLDIAIAAGEAAE